MIYFVYGPDGYRVKEAVRSIRQKIRNESSLPLTVNVLDCAEPTASSLLDGALKHASLFPEIRCTEMKGVFAQKTLAQDLAALLQKTDISSRPDAILIVSEAVEESVLMRKNKALFALLAGSSTHTARVPFLSGSELEKWVCQELQSRGASAEPAAIKELIRRTGNESWMLVQEIDKLSNYCGATAIRAEDVGSVVAERSELNIFEFTDALSAKDKPRALSLLYRELNSGRDPYSVLALVIHQFRNLMMVKDLTLRSSAPAGIAVKVGVPPFVAQKLTAAARKFEQPELAADYRRLQDLDTGVKQGKIDLKDALYSFVLRP